MKCCSAGTAGACASSVPTRPILPPTSTDPGAHDRPRSQPLGAIDLEPVLEVVPGSLPRLRFGHNYHFRVRTVDLAGNSLLADDPTTGLGIESNPLPALRTGGSAGAGLS